MQEFPHHYEISARGDATGPLTCRCSAGEELKVNGPVQFDGPGDAWSPEELFLAAAGNCLILTFRAMARASKLEWSGIDCQTSGVLDKVERRIRFTHIRHKVKLRLPEGADQEKLCATLKKAEEICLITNSVSSQVELDCEVEAG